MDSGLKTAGMTIRRAFVARTNLPCWLAEVAAVVTRLSPDTARQDIEDLCEMELETLNTTEVYLKACELSSKLCHHLFDTLYHAVALILPDAILITADEHYYRKSNSAGGADLTA